MTDQPPSAVARFFGMILMAVGGLTALLCGLCTAGFAVVFFMDGMRGSLASVLMPLMIGALPILIGVGLFAAGRSLYRGPGPKA